VWAPGERLLLGIGAPAGKRGTMPHTPRFISLGTEVQLEFEGIEDRYRSRVVGVEPEEFIILRKPAALSPVLFRRSLTPGAGITVRYFFGGSVWGFRTRLLQKVTGLVQLILVRYPKQIENYDLRQAERVETHIPCRISQDEASVEGVVNDLSETGACVMYRSEVEVGRIPGCEVKLEIPILGTATPALIGAVVRKVQETGGRCTLGLQFIEGQEEAQTAIRNYLAKLREFLADESAD